ncbi:MAG: SEC-C metal-binding domain-containing protein [Pelobium sp.]
MNNNFKLFKKEAEVFCLTNPLFVFSEGENQTPEIFGRLSLIDEQGLLIDSYQIRIVGSMDFPKRFPFVFEEGGRIPLNIDWHLYPDGHCCICSIPEEIMICNKGLTLNEFIENHVKPFFFNQKHREIYGYFLKERHHGHFGNIEFFQEAFQTDDLRLIANLLNHIRTHSEPGRVQDCFCNSGKKYRKCHREAFRLFKDLPDYELKRFSQFILAYNYSQ